ncbi:MAG TPA: hypothetical protein VF117_07885 [Gammaproteobacteria bacterium]
MRNMKLTHRRLHRHTRSVGRVMVLLLAIASLQTAWGCTVPQAVKMASCCVGTSCPENHTTSCVQARDTAVPSMLSAAQDPHPSWVALPVQPALHPDMPASALERQPRPERYIVASGPPIQLRFCSFLK